MKVLQRQPQVMEGLRLDAVDGQPRRAAGLAEVARSEEAIDDPGHEQAVPEQRGEHEHRAAGEEGQHDERLVAGGGDHAAGEGTERHRAVHVQGDVGERPEAPRHRSDQDGGQPPAALLQPLPQGSASRDVEVLDQEHHDQDEPGDQEGVCENGNSHGEPLPARLEVVTRNRNEHMLIT